MDNKEKKENGPPLSPLSVYSRAVKRMGMDSVHEAISRRGVDILQRGVPYVVVAARWQKYREYRKKSGRELPTDKTDAVMAPPSIWNPYEKIARNETSRIILEALSEFPNEDVIAVWDKMKGYTDEEIRKKWVELGIGPENPKLSLIRKRRERALKKLRSILEKRLSDKK